MSDTSGFGGAGYIDPATGEWVSTPGTGINSNPRIINTPNSSTGEPAYADPAAPGWNGGFATPQGGQLTTTPNSRTGAPAPGIRNLPAVRPGAPMQLPGAQPPTPAGATVPSTAGMGLGVGGPLITGAGLLAGAPTTDQGLYNNANSFNDWFNNTRIGHLLNRITGQAEPRWGSPNPMVVPSGAPTPVTQPAGQPQGVTVGGRAIPPMFGPPIPPGGVPPPPQPPGPFFRGPLPPPGVPQAARAPAVQRAPSNINLGYGAPGVTPQAPSPMFTTIDRPNADIAGGRSVAGQLAPQYFTPAREPGGPAQMGALDLSGLFRGGGTPPPAGPLATPTGRATPYNVAGIFNNIPNNTFNGAVGGGGRAAPSQVARAPTMQRQSFFANPRNWQYPNIPF